LINKISISGWANTSKTSSEVVSVKCLNDIISVVDYAKISSKSICSKGAGNSYGDQFQNENNIVVDITRFNNVISWDPKVGIFVSEPGVSLQKVLAIVLKDQWILPAVPGVRNPTLSGALSNNIHGKNSYIEGNFGECVIEFDICLANKKIVTCSKSKNTDLFSAVIGGAGLLGIITKVTLQLKKIISTDLSVKIWTVENLSMMISEILKASKTNDFVIGQIDSFSKNESLGRGTIHAAVYCENRASNTEFINDLVLPKRLFYVLPPLIVLNIAKILINSFTMRIISSLKYLLDKKLNTHPIHYESFPKFNFLLDRIPNWSSIFRNGFYEFEPLIPVDKAEKVIRKILEISHKCKMPPYLAGIKLHKKDDFLLSYSMDGFSIGLDYPVLQSRKKEQIMFFQQLNEIILQNNGLIYLAKDELCNHRQFVKMYKKNFSNFIEIKKKYDPTSLFQSNIFRRLFLAN